MKRAVLLLSLLLALPLWPADIKTGFGTDNQTITCTVENKANNNQRACTAIDNTSNKFLDALIFLKYKSGGSGTSATGYVNIYAGGTIDTGTPVYTENFGGSDADITLTSPPNIKWIGTCNVVANATTYYCGPFSVRAAFGGTLPEKWFLVIENKTGGTSDTTGGNHSVKYQGIYATSN